MEKCTRLRWAAELRVSLAEHAASLLKSSRRQADDIYLFICIVWFRMSFGHVRFTFMGFKGQICIGRGFHFSVHNRAATARSLAFPGLFHFTRILERVIFVFAPNQIMGYGTTRA